MSEFTIESFIEIFTDGACRGNPGIGGWGALLCYRDVEKELKGVEIDTTNNRMELTATIKALSALKNPSRVRLWTDSKYVQQGITEWVPNWKKRNWRTSANKAVKNKDLWQLLDSRKNQHEIQWRWVKGHAGNRGNEIADRLANDAIDQYLEGASIMKRK
ncbi:MAG TPA: ribonuclease HI [Gammaproteobacteria bacterium]|nr:ribonuclease HI [Gammaproteobacteria bacterium]